MIKLSTINVGFFILYPKKGSFVGSRTFVLFQQFYGKFFFKPSLNFHELGQIISLWRDVEYIDFLLQLYANSSEL